MRRRLLLVEDDATLRQALTFNLAREGYEVSTAADGEAALDAARSERLDLVLLDVMLPGMSGVEVLRVLRREGVTTPVIIWRMKSLSPNRMRPLASTPVMQAPSSVPMTVPRPPLRLVPPMMTAAIALSSKPIPMIGLAMLRRAM